MASSSRSRSSALSIPILSRSLPPEPCEDFVRVLARRKHGIEDLLDPSVLENERQSLYQDHTVSLEGRQRERPHKGEVLVAQELEGQVEPHDRLPLVSSTLGAEAEHPRAEFPELRVVVPKGARLRGASPGARNLVPTLR